MPYTVTSTEKTTGKAADHETKAMLYLMNFHTGCEDIQFFVIDFFNDVTGIDALATKALDIQSKASSNLSGKAIGKDLVTLYKNFLSDLKFTDYILFVGGISPNGLLDRALEVFGLDNFNEKYKNAIFTGLKEEALAKTYIDDAKVVDNFINEFLSKVIFVISNKSKAEYVKEIIKVNSSIIVSDDYLESIFNQIRDNQSVKKNINSEGIIINCLNEFHKYKKFLTSDQIKMLVLSRLINKDSMNDILPTSFTYMLDGRTDRVEFVEECRHAISRMLFDKNNAKAYWRLFEEIYTAIKGNPQSPVEEIYGMLNEDLLRSIPALDFNSARFFVALVKDGLG